MIIKRKCYSLQSKTMTLLSLTTLKNLLGFTKLPSDAIACVNECFAEKVSEMMEHSELYNRYHGTVLVAYKSGNI